MANDAQLESHHGVLMRIADHGVLIIGPAGSGKSSLALELLYQGHQLIADDIVEFSKQENSVIGHCPPMLEKLLHTRELGLISIPSVFGQQAWQPQSQLDVVIALDTDFKPDLQLTLEKKYYPLLNQSFPLLRLSRDNPASFLHRIYCWLAMQKDHLQPEKTLKQRQQHLMSNTPYRELS